jgi:antitoxin (DNA-binding transcriptional repressor) of toxin-antitoxin stability system
MSAHSLVEAKNKLSQLIDRGQKGEAVATMRIGTPAAELRPSPAPPLLITRESLDRLAARRVSRRNATEDAGALVSRMRGDEER